MDSNRTPLLSGMPRMRRRLRPVAGHRFRNREDQRDSGRTRRPDVPLTEREIDKLREDTANWTAAVEHISKYRDTIKMETTSGTPAHAHRALDFLDYVLQWLPEIAQKSNVPKDHWQTIGENSQTLRDAFDTIHTHIDNGTSPSYEAVAAEIDAAVESLAAIPGGASSETELPE